MGSNFGSQGVSPPDILSVGLMTDTDNVQSFLSDKTAVSERFANEVLRPLGVVFKVRLKIGVGRMRSDDAALTAGSQYLLGQRGSLDCLQSRWSNFL